MLTSLLAKQVHRFPFISKLTFRQSIPNTMSGVVKSFFNVLPSYYFHFVAAVQIS